MDLIELGAHQPAPAVGGVGADNLGLAELEGDALIGPDLRDVANGGDDLPGCGVLHDGEIAGPESGVSAAHQVEHPGVEAHVGLRLAYLEEGVCVEIGQPFAVLGGRLSQD